MLIASTGGILLANANHLAALFLGIELISLPLFGLIGYAFRQKRSLEASIKYTILSAAASSFLLFGMALVYAQSGNLSFEALGKSLGDGMLHEPLLLAGFGLMIVGLGFKLSLVPFHLWTPDVYRGAPVPVSTFPGDGEQNRYLRRGDASVPVCAGRRQRSGTRGAGHYRLCLYHLR